MTRARARIADLLRVVAMTILVLVPTTAPVMVQAQTERSGNADARVAQQLQQLTNERMALQAEVVELKQELEQARKELAGANSAKSSLESRNRTLEATAGRGQAAQQSSEEQLERTRDQLQDLVAKFRETAQTLREVETDRATVTSQLVTKEREFSTCVDRNAALYLLNDEVLDRMQSRGFWSSVTEREPFTKLKRVQLENLIDDYRYRAEELRLEQQQASAQ